MLNSASAGVAVMRIEDVSYSPPLTQDLTADSALRSVVNGSVDPVLLTQTTENLSLDASAADKPTSPPPTHEALADYISTLTPRPPVDTDRQGNPIFNPTRQQFLQYILSISPELPVRADNAGNTVALSRGALLQAYRNSNAPGYHAIHTILKIIEIQNPVYTREFIWGRLFDFLVTAGKEDQRLDILSGRYYADYSKRIERLQNTITAAAEHNAEINLQWIGLSDLHLSDLANTLGISFPGINLVGAFLERVIATNLDFTNASLPRARLAEGNFRDARFRGANLTNTDMQDANFREAELQRANLSYADMRDTDFSEANLTDATLSQVRARGGTNFQQATLVEADLSVANLERTWLLAANLRKAKLHNASLEAVYMGQADLRGTNFKHARFVVSPLSHDGVGAYSVNMSDAIFGRTAFSGWTNFAGVDLSRVILIRSNYSPNTVTVTLHTQLPDYDYYAVSTAIPALAAPQNLTTLLFVFTSIHPFIRYDASVQQAFLERLTAFDPINAPRINTLNAVSTVTELLRLVSAMDTATLRTPVIRTLVRERWRAFQLTIELTMTESEQTQARQEIEQTVQALGLQNIIDRLNTAQNEFNPTIGELIDSLPANLRNIVVDARTPGTHLSVHDLRAAFWNVYQNPAAVGHQALQRLITEIRAANHFHYSVRYIVNHLAVALRDQGTELTPELLNSGYSQEVRYGMRQVWYAMVAANRADSAVDLSTAYLRSVDFTLFPGLNLVNANLQRMNVNHAILTGLNLQYANLTGATLEYADLRGADLQHANLVGANLAGANFESANLAGARITAAQMAELRAAGLTDQQLANLVITDAPAQAVANQASDSATDRTASANTESNTGPENSLSETNPESTATNSSDKISKKLEELGTESETPPLSTSSDRSSSFFNPDSGNAEQGFFPKPLSTPNIDPSDGSDLSQPGVTVVPIPLDLGSGEDGNGSDGPGGPTVQTPILTALQQAQLRQEQRQPVRQRVGAGLNQDSSTPSVAPLVEAAISLLKQQPDGFARIELLRQWAARKDPKLEALLGTEDGVEQLLTYGYQGNVLQALTVNGYSALLVEFGTAQHAATIAEQAQRANPLLAEQATIFNARLQQVQRHAMQASPTPPTLSAKPTPVASVEPVIPNPAPVAAQAAPTAVAPPPEIPMVTVGSVQQPQYQVMQVTATENGVPVKQNALVEFNRSGQPRFISVVPDNTPVTGMDESGRWHNAVSKNPITGEYTVGLAGQMIPVVLIPLTPGMPIPSLGPGLAPTLIPAL